MGEAWQAAASQVRWDPSLRSGWQRGVTDAGESVRRERAGRTRTGRNSYDFVVYTLWRVWAAEDRQDCLSHL